MAIAVLALCLSAPAVAQSLPDFDVNRRCDIHDGRSQMIVRECVQTEQLSYNVVKAYWPRLAAPNKTRCLTIAQRPRSQNYEVLAACLEYDIRKAQAEDIPEFKR